MSQAARRIIAKAGDEITTATIRRLKPLGDQMVPLQPRVTERIEYLTADEEERFVVAQANAKLNAHGHFTEELVEIREGDHFDEVPPWQVHYMDISPKQIVSVATSLIPFLEHDDANAL